MKLDWRKTLFPPLFLLSCLPCKAQFELSAGPVFSLPQILVSSGKIVDAWQIINGGSVGLDHNPKGFQFFPSCRFSLGQTQLPIQQNGTDLGALTFGYFSVMANGAYTVTVRHTGQLVLYSGIGLLSLTEKYIPSSASSSQNLIVGIDSITNVSHIFPSANIGAEYKGKTFGKKFCWSLGLNLQYSRLVEGNNIYYLQVAGLGPGATYYHEPASLSGDLFQPTIYLTLNYKPGKKANSWYL